MGNLGVKIFLVPGMQGQHLFDVGRSNLAQKRRYAVTGLVLQRFVVQYQTE